MRPYEVVLILEASAEEETVDATVNRVKEVVTAQSGKVGQVEKWGRKRFAYELNHRWEGNYTLVEFSAKPNAIAELDRVLSLSDEVVRHKIVRIPESVVGQPRPSISSKSEDARATGEGS